MKTTSHELKPVISFIYGPLATKKTRHYWYYLITQQKYHKKGQKSNVHQKLMPTNSTNHSKEQLPINQLKQLQIGAIKTHLYHINSTQDKTLKKSTTIQSKYIGLYSERYNSRLAEKMRAAINKLTQILKHTRQIAGK